MLLKNDDRLNKIVRALRLLAQSTNMDRNTKSETDDILALLMDDQIARAEARAAREDD